MQITFVPMRMDAVLDVTARGDCLVLNGQVVDLSGVTEGARIEAASFNSDWLVDDVSRQKGELSLSLILPLAADAPSGARFPAPIQVSSDGPIELPSASTATSTETTDLTLKPPSI